MAAAAAQFITSGIAPGITCQSSVLVFSVSTQSANGPSDDALRQTKALRPDVVLVDISLGAESGIDLAQRLIQDRGNDSVVVLISTRSEDEVADLIAERPPIVFLPKSELSAATIRRIVEANASGTRGK